MSAGKTTPRPWKTTDLRGNYCFTVVRRGPSSDAPDFDVGSEADAELIVQAVNAHDALVAALNEARDALDDRSDVEDSDDGPKPNWAMRLVSEIDEALSKIGGRR